MFTARTTRVSNPFRDPSLHPLLSELYSQSAFAVVSPNRINAFYCYPICTLCVFQSLAIQYLLHAPYLRYRISQETYKASYECFRPNNCGCDLNCRDYRGGWHRSFPLLILQTFCIWQKILNENHSGSLCHACAHCRRFLTAAPRRARNSVSDSFLGPPR